MVLIRLPAQLAGDVGCEVGQENIITHLQAEGTGLQARDLQETVDEVRQVVRLPGAAVEVASSVLGGDLSEHVMGIARPSGNLIVLLDLNSVVAI